VNARKTATEWLNDHMKYMPSDLNSLAALLESVEREAFDAGFKRGTQEGARGSDDESWPGRPGPGGP
jgi:hypothetical protein